MNSQHMVRFRMLLVATIASLSAIPGLHSARARA